MHLLSWIFHFKTVRAHISVLQMRALVTIRLYLGCSLNIRSSMRKTGLRDPRYLFSDWQLLDWVGHGAYTARSKGLSDGEKLLIVLNVLVTWVCEPNCSPCFI